MGLFNRTINIKGLTQEQVVKKHLQKYKELTSAEAISKYGITRLSAYIYIMRESGYSISTTIMPVRNRYGNNSNIAVYKLVAEPGV